MVAASALAVGRFPTVLVTGFAPFGGSGINPSWMAAQALHGRLVAGHRLIGAQLPTVFGDSLLRLRELMHRHRPALVVCTGQAAGRAALSLERIAINVNDAHIPDNAGAQPIDTPVIPGGPAAYFTSLPIKAMLVSMIAEGINTEVSQTAGTFVCNHVFYALMHELATRHEFGHARGGLIHLPWVPGQGQPSMRLDEIVRGLRVAISCALVTLEDIRKEAGGLS
jgi:pyroglutamyl-peptidase